MENIYINGIGIETPLRIDREQEMGNDIMSGIPLSDTYKLDLEPYFKRRDFRRMDRFSILSLLSFEKALNDVKDCKEEETQIATIINTTYGPIETNIDFVDSIVNTEEKTVSPILFSHTVNNAAVGHVCKKYKMKGPSTLLLSSNGIRVAESFLKNQKAKVVFACGAEQYCEDLYNYFEEKGVIVKEAASTLVLSAEKADQSYAKIVGGFEANLAGHPYIEWVQTEKEQIEYVMNGAITDANISKTQIAMVIAKNVNDEIGRAQTEFIKEENEACKIIEIEKVTGEVLGASLNLNLAIAALLIKQGNIRENQYVLVNDYDISGNFRSYVLASCN